MSSPTMLPPFLTLSQGTLWLLSLHIVDPSWKKKIFTPPAAPEREGCLMSRGVPAEVSVCTMSSAQLSFPL